MVIPHEILEMSTFSRAPQHLLAFSVGFFNFVSTSPPALQLYHKLHFKGKLTSSTLVATYLALTGLFHKLSFLFLQPKTAQYHLQQEKKYLNILKKILFMPPAKPHNVGGVSPVLNQIPSWRRELF